ncbi:Protein of unknown function DUF4043 [uncultured Caudovirales phage]|uniref:Major capsid protein n=1 Tax=uncultured Caudovirales phage TaxID=2100421 RepID=A0A6J7WWS3_9CAUD|nr:Protein of unknown function DUF4043 [uncultured Caudovirales phage]
MADFSLATASQRKAWANTAHMEYVRRSRFAGYINNTSNAIIQGYTDLEKKAGDTLNIPLFYKLTGAPVTGETPIVGNETPLDNFNCGVPVALRGKGVAITKNQTFRTELDIMNAAKESLTRYFGELLRDDFIEAFGSVVTTGDTTVNYGLASAANRNAFAAGNQDRLFFGATSGYNATWATALGNVTAAQTTTIARLGVMKRLAMQASPAITPYQVNDEMGREYFVAFHGSRTFRDLKASSEAQQANREVRPRDVENNPIMQDGDLIFDGIIHREVPEIDAWAAANGFNTAGAASAPIRPVYLCGTQSLFVAYAQRPQAGTEKSDIPTLNRRMTVGMDEIIGIKKAAFNGKQHGMVLGFFGAAAD